jgi:hypothetical protein
VQIATRLGHAQRRKVDQYPSVPTTADGNVGQPQPLGLGPIRVRAAHIALETYVRGARQYLVRT